MHPLAPTFAGALADLSGWLTVVSGLAVLGLLVAADDRRKRRREIAASPARSASTGRHEPPAAMPATPAGLGGLPALTALQARAALQIDAAEYAFNRLVGECAKVAALPVAPTFATARELPAQAASPHRPSMAA
jgi:hypothetical protein